MLSDFLASLHTRRAAYRGISLALLGISIFFAVRNGEMYISLLQHFGAFAATWAIPGADVTVPMGQIGMVALQVLLTLTFVYLGFYLSTHQTYVLEAQLSRIQRHAAKSGADAGKELKAARSTFNWIIWFVIASDVASATYVIFASMPNLSPASFTSITLDAEILAALVAWSVLVFVEFKIGPFLLALAESLPAERKQEFALQGIEQAQEIKARAMSIVVKEARNMDLARAQAIVRQTAERRIEQEDDPLMQDLLRELQDIAPQGPGAQPVPPRPVTIKEEPAEEVPPLEVEPAAEPRALRDPKIVTGQFKAVSADDLAPAVNGHQSKGGKAGTPGSFRTTYEERWGNESEEDIE